jgi:hypothetical protein
MRPALNEQKGKRVTDYTQELLKDFADALGVEWSAPADLIAAATTAIKGCSE